MKALFAAKREMLADTDTPVSAYGKLCRGKEDSFLLESGEGADGSGRYSVVAWDPLACLELDDKGACMLLDGVETTSEPAQFFDLARRLIEDARVYDLPDLPAVGSLIGYIGYEAVRLMEDIPKGPRHHLPVARLARPSRFVVFDHLKRKMTILALAETEGIAESMLDEIQGALADPFDLNKVSPASLDIEEPDRQSFIQAVVKAKEYIMAGDIFQVVLSAPFRVTGKADPLLAYRWLRVLNPSPYMFFLHMPGFHLAGASPETLVKVEDGQVHLRPIAGTRGRSPNHETDMALERELLESEKERAEHIMLVDLARNDAGRVSEFGSVKVSPYMRVERYSHVMHLVSQVHGRLKQGASVWDAFQASFPAGTLSGAPKVRAMEIINELEAPPRGPYGGAVGFFGPGERMDTCIAIRMIQFEEDSITLQAGAGIVADSDPLMEYQEIKHKAAQGIAALRAAAEGLA